MSASTRSWQRGALLLAGLTAALLLGELVLRAAGISHPEFYRFDPVTGGSHLPGAEGWWTKESRTYVRINSHGLRDREHEYEKPPETLRVAVLGDSYAEAFQVATEDTFWAVMERELAGCEALHGRAVESLNFGVAGFGTAQELLTLRHRVWRYDPDVVVLAFLTGNDLRNNARAREGSSGRPYFVYRDGDLVLDDRFLQKSGSRLEAGPLGVLLTAAARHSRLYQLYQETRRALRRRREGEREVPPASGHEAGLDDAVYRPPEDDVWREAWRVSEGLLRTMNDEVEARGARFLLAILSNAAQVHPDPAFRAEVAREIGVDDLLYPDRRLEAFAEREGLPVLALAPPLRAWAEAHGTCVHGFPGAHECDGHWNEHGHRVAGELIAARLCRALGAEGVEAHRSSRSGRRSQDAARAAGISSETTRASVSATTL